MLLFIWNSAIGSFVKFTISKHLMLLFIGVYADSCESDYAISKHLMLLFINNRFMIILPWKQISKHLMLLFIFAFLSYSSYFLQHFKTSHVIVYRFLTPMKPLKWLNFKTSHVIVYLFFRHNIAFIHLHFKTSHVIVYQDIKQSVTANQIFQNISCYCLSLFTLVFVNTTFISKHLMLLFIDISAPDIKFVSAFQNISCYCLSGF